MIESMEVGFCFSGVDAALSDGFDNTCTVSEKWNVSRVIPRLYGWVYKSSRLTPLVVEHSVVVNECGFPIKTIPDWILWVGNARLPFVFRISGGIKFWDPVEDSDTGGPSSITVRMNHLFAFQFWFCELCVENQWGGGRKHCFVIFVIWLCFNRRGMRSGGVGQKILFRTSWNRIFFQLGF